MKILLKSTFVLLLLVFSPISKAATYYSSPTGKSTNTGTSANSPLDLLSGINKLVAGDVLQLAGGTYTIPFVKDTKNTIFLTKSGTAQKPITIQAANGQKATLDFSFPPQEWVQDGFGFDITGDYWYFKNINITRAGYHGVYVKGDYNTFENCAFYENRNTGLEINKGGSYTTVINCDAYRNYDPKKLGSMADGFGPKQTMGPGNKFIGCRAWENSDDGYDCYDSPEVVTFENCWAFRNGVDVWNYGGFSGNGNGFKLGGNDAVAKNKTNHCVSFGHPNKGFDQNNNKGALTILNCTSYDNGNNYGIGAATASGEKHYFRNNISIDSKPSISNADQAYNSWNSGFSVSTSDFISLNMSLATVARNADGSLPYTDLFRLKPTSKLVNAGTNVGLPYEGSAPDLGAFEVAESTNKDCNGVENGSAYLDNCAVCVGGNTGATACTQDCAGIWGGNAVFDDCGVCGGSNACADCNGDIGGNAYLDNCGVCVGGNSVNQTCVGSLEAEEACTFDGVLLESTNAGFSGEGYVNTTNATGAQVSWVLNSDLTQTATLSFRYANGGTTSRDGIITINGTSAGNLALPSTGAWTTWETVSVNLNLTQGSNNVLVTATTTDGLANIDLISFSSGISDAMCLVTRVDYSQTNELKIYPNPTTNSVQWDVDEEWELFNNQGLTLANGKGKTLSLVGYPSGIYLIKLKTQKVKIVKQ